MAAGSFRRLDGMLIEVSATVCLVSVFVLLVFYGLILYAALERKACLKILQEEGVLSQLEKKYLQ